MHKNNHGVTLPKLNGNIEGDERYQSTKGGDRDITRI